MPGAESIRVALVHDWLTGMRGGERVLEALLELVPRAEIFTLERAQALMRRTEGVPKVIYSGASEGPEGVYDTPR